MSIKLKNTMDVFMNGFKCLIFGESGVGKTTLIGTLTGKTLILSAEAGLLSLSGKDIPYIVISSIDDLYEAYSYIIGEEGSEFDTIAIDSISEIADVLLHEELKKSADPRKGYGEMQTKIADIIRRFRDIPKNIIMTATLEKTQDDLGRLLYSPAMPGKKAGQKLPYQFDLVLALRAETDQEGQRIRALQTQSDGIWLAKDRSGRLEFWESPDLGSIISKLGEQKS